MDNTRMKKLVSHKNIAKYIPGNTTSYDTPKGWDALQLNIYSHPLDLEDGPAPASSHHALGCILSGHIRGEYSSNNNSWKRANLKKNHSILLPRNTPINWRWKTLDQNPVVNSVLYFPHEILTNIVSKDFSLETTTIKLCEHLHFFDDFLKQISLRLKNEVENNNPYGRLFAESISQTLGVYLLQHYCTVSYKNLNHANQLYKHTFKRVLDFCHDHYNQEIALRDLAAVANLSESHFLRIFKKHTGKTPVQYIIQLRMEKAKQLLKTTNWSVLVVGLEVGYNSPSHFNGLFKRYTGVTPLRYRQQVL